MLLKTRDTYSPLAGRNHLEMLFGTYIRKSRQQEFNKIWGPSTDFMKDFDVI